MEINVGKHRLSYDGTSYQLTRVSKAKKDDSDYLSDYAYYARMDRAVLALLERVMGEGKRRDAETVATPRRYFVYVLVKEVEDALERVRFLKGLDLDCYAQPYRDFLSGADPTQEQRDFARWVNHKAIFKSVVWEDYIRNKRKAA